MMPDLPLKSMEGPLIVGIEGGATRTSILAVRGRRKVAEFQLGPSSVLMPEPELQAHFGNIAARLAVTPTVVGIGLAAARTDVHCALIRSLAGKVWPGVPVHATSDLETALAAEAAPFGVTVKILVLSGTGSCCFGRDAAGRTAKIGGRGHIIGDRASATDIGRSAVRAVLAALDRTGRWGHLGRMILESLGLNDPEDLIPWSMRAEKTEIAAVAMPVFRAAQRRDPVARSVLAEAAASLAEDGAACARRLAGARDRVHFVLNGGVLTKNPGFAKSVCRLLRQRLPGASAAALRRPSVWGAVELARATLHSPDHVDADNFQPAPAIRSTALVPGWISDFSTLAQSPTEQRNPKSSTLDTMPLEEAGRLMLDEDARLPDAVRTELPAIVRVIRQIVRAFQSGGRLFYVGAGTSGRLGVLDASEIPPTFRAPSDLVQGIIAGGRPALWSAVEGAEDDPAAGAAAAEARQMGRRDVVVGIAASGRTPFVWGCLSQAARQGAFTVLVCFNPAVKSYAGKAGPKRVPREIIAPFLGPEILTGSTRLKSGTATKLILNMFTTLAMTRMGKVAGNLMIDLNPSNLKLRDRAVRILHELTGADSDTIRRALEAAQWSVPRALQRLRRR